MLSIFTDSFAGGAVAEFSEVDFMVSWLGKECGFTMFVVVEAKVGLK